MAPTTPPGSDSTALERIEDRLGNLTASMATKDDLKSLTTAIQDTLRAEIAGIRSEVASHAGRISRMEEAAEALMVRQTSADTAIARQGTMLLSMRRHLEDLDNRGRRCNIRILGVPEDEGTAENVVDILTEIFQTILQPTSPEHIEFERAHRITRPRSLEDGPRDLICCLHSFPVKDTIMRKARERPTWPYRGAQVALYNDLSPITLEARGALRPVTAALRDRNISYKWGFPFALLARHHNGWISMRWPEDVPRFMEELGLSTPVVPNWILGPTAPVPRPQRVPRRREARSPSVQPARRRRNPTSPEE
ncbi:Hypothetical predicted protein [Pelobates cultripes]|uniref:L1 transposable element RRM domain-containing protein n=1 Tax=Pelobates cultripes TaxID=61616 RepID=A0AAD1S135_PELCU|nr:Hypothetical predicted protein [Pelobates cultripes]